jgi:formyl-CoA transferase
MATVNPRLVYASISGYGEDGPYRLRPGFDQIAQGMGGLMSITGLPGQGPVRVGIPIADLCSGLFCAWGIAVAVIEREKSGRGQWVKSSLLQAQLFMLDFQAARWLMNGEVARQAGNNHPTSIPTGVYRTRDGHMNLAVSGHKIWLRLCNAIGAPELATHADYATAALRSQHRDQLHGDLEAQLAHRDTAEWVELLNEAGVPCGPIYSIDQAFSDPQVRDLGMVEKLDDVAYLGQPVTLSRTPAHVVAHPPTQGEHTDEVLRELGYDPAGIERLKRQGIV